MKPGLSWPVDVINDGMRGVISGTSRSMGVNVAVGSSINCPWKNAAGKEGRIVGNGVLFGEYGVGIEINSTPL
jgi:hypothetical protein